MKLIIQRVTIAKVMVDDHVVGKINKGLFVLVGFKDGDTFTDVEIMAEKLSKLRVMSDKEDKMNLSVKDVKASVLVVSQFTLYADTSSGNRPSFIKAAKPDVAKSIYLHFIEVLKNQGITVETGEFGAYMQIDVKLDGPVTIILEK